MEYHELSERIFFSSVPKISWENPSESQKNSASENFMKKKLGGRMEYDDFLSQLFSLTVNKNLASEHVCDRKNVLVLINITEKRGCDAYHDFLLNYFVLHKQNFS